MKKRKNRSIKKPKHRVHWFYDQCWRENFYVLCPATGRDVKDFLKTQFNMEWEVDNTAGGHCLNIINKQGCHRATVIVIYDWAFTPHGLGVLAHESFHAAENTLEACGVKHGSKSSEAFAYLIESIFRRSLNLILKKKSKE